MSSQINWDRYLTEAILNNSLEQVEYFIKRGARIENNTDYNPLYVASRRGNIDIVKYLLEYGANVHSDDDTPLYAACCGTDRKVIRLLVEHGANINSHNGFPLNRAMAYGYYDLTSYFLSLGASISDTQFAGHNCDPDITKLLIRYGSWNKKYDPYDYLYELSEKHLEKIDDHIVQSFIKYRAKKRCYSNKFYDLIISCT